MESIMNKLFYGDNLEVLREHIPDESVDLVYLDPPFNSKRAYNIIFKDKEGKFPPSQIQAFDDTWSWSDDSEEAMWEMSRQPYPPQLFQTLEAFRKALGTTDMMAYLVMMAIRLWELRRVMKDTASIYLHCDPTASHYLKVIMDQIFGPTNYQNEIIWKRTSAHSTANKYGSVHDILLFYSKSSNCIWNNIYQDYDQEYIDLFFDQEDETGRKYKRTDLTGAGISSGKSGEPWRGIDVSSKGRHWGRIPEELEKLDAAGRIHWPKKEGGMPRLKQYPEDLPGIPLQDVINDIRPIHNLAKERLGYPTQKPVALLERIISASSNEGDVVLDPFCGCGTTIAAAEKLNRQWIGIDITPLSINLIEKRLNEQFPDVRYELIGLPRDVEGARKLASTRAGKFEFENWFVTALGGQPYKSSGGGDSGIDGFMYFRDFEGKPHTVILSVKGGSYSLSMVRDLCRVVERENAAMGVLLALEPPTKGMLSEAASAGRFQLSGAPRTYPKVQIFTVEDFFDGKRPDLPDVSDTLKKAKRIEKTPDKPELGI